MQQQLTRDITSNEKQAFWRDGVVCLRNMFDADWVERMRTAVDDAIANPGPMKLEMDQGLAGKFHGDSFVWTWHDDFRAFVLTVQRARSRSKYSGLKSG